MSNNIRMIRKMLKISSSELAGLLNCSMPHIYALETGRINLDEFARIKTPEFVEIKKNTFFTYHFTLDFIDVVLFL